jgi:lipid II:glycine glycyltransferase (peptidoglycan interpeptide bridge formation enzyme)
MQIIEVKNNENWDKFVGAQSHVEFLQSWEWGDFQEKVEGAVTRLGVYHNGEMVAAATLVKKSLPLGMNYFYCPRGAITISDLRFSISDLYNFLFSEIKKIAKKEKTIFLRFEPRKFEIRNSKIAIRKSIDIQPAKTIMLDLSKSEEVLLATMHQKTRYNICLAEKKGVKIIEGGEGGFESFWSLMEKTSGRDKFTAHNKDYYQKLLQTAPEIFKLYVGQYEGKIITSGIFSFFGDTVTYLFGASADEHREVMAPYLLQWELIKCGKAAGCRYYDFFGIDEKKWPGVTRFKHGFSGMQIDYPGTFDVIFNPISYSLYKILRIIRRLF